jgi:hypothetical protein
MRGVLAHPEAMVRYRRLEVHPWTWVCISGRPIFILIRPPLGAPPTDAATQANPPHRPQLQQLG